MEPEAYDKIKQKLRMMFESNRLATFTSWKFKETANCSAAKLAEAGFYFIGTSAEPDAVQCFLCDKALDGWEENDDPWMEHVSHTQNCTFAQLRQPEEALSVQQMLDLRSKVITKNVVNGSQDIVTAVNSKYSKDCLKLKKTLNGLKRF